MKRLVVVALLICVLTGCSSGVRSGDAVDDSQNSQKTESVKDKEEDYLTSKDIPEGSYRDEFEASYANLDDPELIDKLVRQTLSSIEVDEKLKAREEKYGCSYELNPEYFVRNEEGQAYPGNVILLNCHEGDAEELASSIGGKVVGFSSKSGMYIVELSTPFTSYSELEDFSKQEFDQDKYDFSYLALYSAYLYDFEVLGKGVTREQYGQ